MNAKKARWKVVENTRSGENYQWKTPPAENTTRDFVQGGTDYRDAQISSKVPVIGTDSGIFLLSVYGQ